MTSGRQIQILGTYLDKMIQKRGFLYLEIMVDPVAFITDSHKAPPGEVAVKVAGVEGTMHRANP